MTGVLKRHIYRDHKGRSYDNIQDLDDVIKNRVISFEFRRTPLDKIGGHEVACKEESKYITGFDLMLDISGLHQISIFI